MSGLNCKCRAQDTRSALDIAADLVNQLSHRFGDDLTDFGGRQNDQWAQYAREFLEHPDGKAADERRRARYWEYLERATAVADSWPAWVAGERVNKR